MSRLLKLINALLALALLVALGAAYWFAWRVLPQTSGSLSLPVSAAATITRDAQGVPHIRAGSVEDAIFLQGYATAQDRLWSMDVTRRKASGEVSEVVAGRAAVELDLVARRLHLRQIAEQQARRLSPPDRAVLAAYARGVNEFIRTHRNALPLEFTLLGYQPRPWTIVDTLAIGMEMSRTLSQTHLPELLKKQLLATGDRAKVDRLFPVRTGSEVSVGSNAWAIAGSHTVTGKPILANDMHLEFTFPSTWYQVHLTAPGLNVSGVSLPGVPMVIVGHNDRIAWGITNLHFDVMDLYQEKMDGAGRYQYKDTVLQAPVGRETIAVKSSTPISVVYQITRHGFTNTEAGATVALRWAAAEPDVNFIFLQLNQAKNWAEFRQALSRFTGPAGNYVYADVEGNIGYQAAGRLPLRPRTCDSSVPVDGSTDACEWQGWIPFDDLPSVLNPTSGRIISANQNPFPADYKYPVAGRFSANYRARQIEQLLGAKPKHDVSGMLTMQKDVYSSFSHYLARELARVGAARGGDQTLRDAVAVLQAWNGQMEQGQAAPLIAQLAFEHLRREMVQRAAPGQQAVYELDIAPEVIEHLLRERPKDWFPDYDALLLRVLVDALQTGSRLQGKDVKHWDYSRNPQGFVLAHPVLSQLPLIGQYFQIGPVPMAGSSTTVKQTTRRLGPSMRFVADLSRWDASVSNITVGQSGQPFSRHFRDQWDAYYVGQSFPMQFATVDASATLNITPR